MSDHRSLSETAARGTRSPILTYGLLFLYTLGPILVSLLAGGIAHLAGAQLDEGSVHPCIVLGIDIGRPLYILGVAGWLALITISTGLLALLGYSAMLIGGGIAKRMMNDNDQGRFWNEQNDYEA